MIQEDDTRQYSTTSWGEGINHVGVCRHDSCILFVSAEMDQIHPDSCNQVGVCRPDSCIRFS